LVNNCNAALLTTKKLKRKTVYRLNPVLKREIKLGWKISQIKERMIKTIFD
jgi:hypothetical protein